jgi:thioredoxin 1
MMKPILDELTVEYKGKLEVIFYDVWKNESYAKKYNIEIIPTQIFLDPNDKELFRHQGFFPKADILAKWKELGFDFKQ